MKGHISLNRHPERGLRLSGFSGFIVKDVPLFEQLQGKYFVVHKSPDDRGKPAGYRARDQKQNAGCQIPPENGGETAEKQRGPAESVEAFSSDTRTGVSQHYCLRH
jgi:hypothetical protein